MVLLLPRDSLQIWDILDGEIQRPQLPRRTSVHVYPSESSRATTDLATGTSAVIGGCLRSSWLRSKFQLHDRGLAEDADEEITWQPIANTPTELWKFEMAYLAERVIINNAKTAGIFVKDHVSFEVPGINMKGELDLVCIDPSTQVKIGIEIKSIYGHYGETGVFGTPTQRKLGNKGKPKDDHVMQTAIYTWFWRDIISYFKILYISRGSGMREEFCLWIEENEDDWDIYIDGELQDFTINNILTRYGQMTQALENNVCPPREYDLQYTRAYLGEMASAGMLGKTDLTKYQKGHKLVKGDWRCSYCSYKHFCYDSQNHPITDNVIGRFGLDIISEEGDPPEETEYFSSSYELYHYLNTLDNQSIELTFNAENIYSGMVDSFLADYKPLAIPVRNRENESLLFVIK